MCRRHDIRGGIFKTFTNNDNMKNSRIVRANIPAQNTRLPLIGKIRVGEKATNSAGKEYPVSLDYFKAVGSYAAKFNEVYDKPDRIQIVFISDDNWQSCFEEWDGRDKEGRRAGYGDGETYHLWNYGKNEYTETINRQTIAEFTRAHSIKWRQVLTINFIIPAIKGVFGVWQLQTGGDKSSINAIRNTFDEIKELAGTVVNIPFDLCVKKVTSNKPESKSIYPVISLVPNISAENMEQLRSFFEAGLDIKKVGMLTETKMHELGEHVPQREKAMVEISNVGSDYCENCGAPEIEGVCSEGCISLKPSGEILPESNTQTTIKKPITKRAGTVLDAAADTAKFTGENSEFLDLSKRIKNCRNQSELRELYAIEPLLFEQHDPQAESLWDDRFNSFTGGSKNG